MSAGPLSDKIHVLLPRGESRPVEGGRSLLEIGAELQPYYAAPIVAAVGTTCFTS